MIIIALVVCVDEVVMRVLDGAACSAELALTAGALGRFVRISSVMRRIVVESGEVAVCLLAQTLAACIAGGEETQPLALGPIMHGRINPCSAIIFRDPQLVEIGRVVLVERNDVEVIQIIRRRGVRTAAHGRAVEVGAEADGALRHGVDFVNGLVLRAGGQGQSGQSRQVDKISFHVSDF